MDYKKAYEEALERARALHALAISKGYPRDYVKEYETVFPELAESYDDIIREELVEAFAVYGNDSFWNGIPIKSILAWLKKQKEQNPAEWSEEDEEMRSAIIREIEWERSNTTFDKDIRIYDKEINWLKSLRPQSKWKPSEEQLKALKYVAYHLMPDENYRDEMFLLYEQLKKLMEED